MISTIFTTFVILTAVTGLLINGYILTAIVLTRQVKSATHILLFHLGIIQILIGILFLVVSIPGAHEWLSIGEPCSFHGFLFTLLQPLALWTIGGLNFNRFYVIAVPLHYDQIVTSKKVLIAVGVIWSISLLLTIPLFFNVATFPFIPRLGICQSRESSGKGRLLYYTIYIMFTLVLPAMFIIFCNIKIFIIARYHQHRIASAIYQVAVSAQMAITHQKNPLPMPFEKVPPPLPAPKFHSTVYTLFEIVGSFFLLYLPYYLVILWDATVESMYSDSTNILNSNVYMISSILLLFTVPVNGFLYGVKGNPLTDVARNYWRKQQTKHELNQEIQARTPSVCGSRRPSFLNHTKNAVVEVNRILKSPSKRPRTPNTLQVPSNNSQGISLVTEDEIYNKLKMNNKRSTYNFLKNIFVSDKKENNVSNMYIPLKCLIEKDRVSPNILVTKPSEESCSSSNGSDSNTNINLTKSACDTIEEEEMQIETEI